MTLASGARLGPYEILAPLGAGGMGEVYRARDSRLDRIVAIKILPESLAGDPASRERFEREARAIAALSHPNILAIFDVNVAAGSAYVVSELVEGDSLRARLANGAVPARKSLEYAAQIAQGLAAAHAKGIVHRDLKPENVLVTPDGHVKIIDFGLAKVADPAVVGGVSVLATRDRGTAPGTVLGTVGYMAPEQVRGQDVDARADLFALGVILFELVTGHRAFQADSAVETMSAILKIDPLEQSTTDLPEPIERIVRHLLEKQADERYQSARDAAYDLRALLQSSPASGAAAARTEPGALRHMTLERAGWAAALVALAAALVYSGRSHDLVDRRVVRFEIAPPAGESILQTEISPDGQQLAVVLGGPDGRHLALRNLASADFRRLAGTGDAIYPFWSPDSRSIGFAAGDKLKRIDIASGAAPQVICDVRLPRGATWGRDGVIVLASSVNGPLMKVADGGGTPEPLPFLKGVHSLRWPHFLPDGRQFLFFRLGRDAEDGIYVGSLDRSDARRVAGGFTEGRFAAGRLLFVKDGALLASPFDPVKAVMLSGDPVMVASDVSGSGNEAGYAFSASDAGELAVVQASHGRASRLTWVDRAGRVQDTVGEAQLQAMPELSPDGTRVAVSRLDAVPPIGGVPVVHLWTRDLERGVEAKFTSDDVEQFRPIWSNDGRSLTFSFMRKGRGVADIVVKSVDSADAARDVPGGQNQWLQSSSVDGKMLISSRQKTQSSIALMLLPLEAASEARTYIDNGFLNGHARIAPDGHWLAYSSNESGRFEVYVQSFPKPGVRHQVSADGGTQPRWRRDGSELFFVSRSLKLTAVSVTTAGDGLRFGAATPLFDADLIPQASFGGPANGQQYDVTKDGQRFLLNLPVGTIPSPLTVILNWPALLKGAS